MRNTTLLSIFVSFVAMTGVGFAASVERAVRPAHPVQTVRLSQEVHQDGEDEDRKRHRVVIRRDFTTLGGGFMGVEVLGLTPELRQHFGADEDRGVMISKVEPSSPAEAAGIRVGDLVISVDGEDVEGPMTLSSLIRKREKGDTVNIELIRSGAVESVSLTVGEREGGGIYRVGPGAFGFLGSGGEHVLGPDGDFEFEWTEDSRRSFEEAMETLQENLESGEWKEKLELIESMDFSRVQERMKEVERRLKELEKELEKSGKKSEK